MSELPENIQQQKLIGYVMLVGALFAFGVTAATVQYYSLSPISYLGGLVPAGILVFFGYRAVSASNNRKALGDERTTELFGKVSINAFWWLMAIILIDGTFNIFPGEGSNNLFIFSGLAIYGLYYVYYRYIE